MTPPRDDSAKTGRRAELLHLAADLFASRGVRATTVRDIADAAGILSGSLYHHFDSKESMVDEILRGFLDDLFDRYRKIVAAGSIPARRSKRSSPRPTNRSTDRTLRSRSTRTRPSISTATGSPTSPNSTPNSAHCGGCARARNLRRLIPTRRGRRRRLPFSPRHGVGRGALVSAWRSAQCRTSCAAVPFHRSRWTVEPEPRIRSNNDRGVHRRCDPHSDR